MGARVQIDFNEAVFEQILRSPATQRICHTKAKEVLSCAQASAPVDTGDYRRGLRLEKSNHAKRFTEHVSATDKKSLLVEAKTGNLIRALRAVKK